MTAIEKLKEISAFLESKGIDNPTKEAEILITETLHISKSELYSDNMEISDEASRHIDPLAQRRANGEPMQYVIGYVEFYGLKISVGRGVLIPRPETELLVEETIKQLKKRFAAHDSRFRVLDICTGSGCIALALAKHFSAASIYGVDISEDALVYARRNALQNHLDNITFLKGELFEPAKGMLFDLIVSNPPYVKKEDIEALQKEIRDYEPIEALDGGIDGMDFYKKIISGALTHLRSGGLLALEIGIGQADAVEAMAQVAGFSGIRIMKDYAGIKRIVTALME